MIVNGEVGIGKSYLIYVLCIYFKDKCKVIVIIGKVVYVINGIIIYFFLWLFVIRML